MAMCVCGHEDHQHQFRLLTSNPPGDGGSFCSCCGCRHFDAPRRTISFTDLPVSQGARDLYAQLIDDEVWQSDPAYCCAVTSALRVLAAADERDVRNLLWARRVGKL
jgi:hypothetical protein